MTAAVQVTALNQNYQQAGLRVYTDDANWASVHMISAGGQRQFEFIYEANNNPRNEAADHGPVLPENAPLAYFVRIHSDGTNLTAQYSFDGEDVDDRRPAGAAEHVHQPAHRAGRAERSGARASRWPTSTGSGSTPDTGAVAAAGRRRSTVTDDFDGTDVGSAWEVMRRDQALTVSRRRAAHPGAQGDVYQTTNTAKNLVVRAMPTGAWTATTKVAFKGSAQYHQAGIILRGDDDNLVKFGRIAPAAAARRSSSSSRRSTRSRATRRPTRRRTCRRASRTTTTCGWSPTGPTSPAPTRPTGRPGPGRPPGGDPGGREDRCVRVQQRRGDLARGGLRLVPPRDPGALRPARRVTTTSPATRWTRPVGTRSCATTRPPTRSAAASSR